METRRKPVLNPALKVAIADFSEEAQKAPVGRRQTKISDKTFYLNVDLSGVGGGLIDLIDNKLKKEVGITNFDGNILNQGRKLSIRSVRALFTSKGASLKVADWQNKDTMPAELQATELSFSQGDSRLIELPMTDIQGFTQADHRNLITNAFVRTQEEFKIQLDFPKNVSCPTRATGKEYFLRIEFRLSEAKS